MLFILTVITVVWMLGDQTPIIRLVYTHLPRLVRGSLYAGFALLAFSMFVALAAAAALERARAWAPAWLPWAVALVTAADLTLVGANRPMNAEYQFLRQFRRPPQDSAPGWFLCASITCKPTCFSLQQEQLRPMAQIAPTFR